ncbi:uncharacterized protein I303_106307 [Kwoniella dejecticola CBS 10117]|uniref:Uncharacterized protein n=1 Tax=Kwoniella dejecticola CBS 10117 TaxID=1296121 RepID=A0A1A6A1V5_9TREE|nr:uncharacterized protein I303_06327 [Kwoniella dejecticola CBS 10117]OBR84040.1 hypothetical protein I303_06327 [Kwoniella dejecticola CBS 10117]
MSLQSSHTIVQPTPTANSQQPLMICITLRPTTISKSNSDTETESIAASHLDSYADSKTEKEEWEVTFDPQLGRCNYTRTSPSSWRSARRSSSDLVPASLRSTTESREWERGVSRYGSGEDFNPQITILAKNLERRFRDIMEVERFQQDTKVYSFLSKKHKETA